MGARGGWGVVDAEADAAHQSELSVSKFINVSLRGRRLFLYAFCDFVITKMLQPCGSHWLILDFFGEWPISDGQTCKFHFCCVILTSFFFFFFFLT